MQQIGIECALLLIEETEHADDAVLNSQRNIEKIANIGDTSRSRCAGQGQFIGCIQVGHQRQFFRRDSGEVDGISGTRDMFYHGL